MVLLGLAFEGPHDLFSAGLELRGLLSISQLSLKTSAEFLLGFWRKGVIFVT